jgi:LEA14-like dessication related protein
MKTRAFVCVVLVLLLAGCAALQRRAALKNCEFALASVDVANATLSDMTLAVGVSAKNTNDIEVVVDKLTYEFFVNGNRAFEGSIGKNPGIAPGETKILNTTVSVNYAEIGMAIAQAVKDNEAKYDLRGTVYLNSTLGTFVFPVFVSK